MKPAIRWTWCAALAAVTAAPLAAQNDLPRTGKVDEVEREARGGDDDDDGDGGWWLIEMTGDVLSAIFRNPKAPGQGYLAYPYAARGALESFVLDDVATGRRFGSFSAARFDDASSSTATGLALSFQGAVDVLHYSLEYTGYRERTATDTDRLAVWRLGVGGVPRVGNAGWIHLGAGLRGVCLDHGECAAGGDVELSTMLFPRRPLGVSVSLRAGGISWGRAASFVTESNTAASVFVGRMELRGGWHWLKIGRASAFSGPLLGARVWF